MKIAVDASCWTNRRGFGRFTRELLNALLEIDSENEYFFLIDSQSAGQCRFPRNATPVLVPTSVAPTAAASAEGNRSLTDLLRMARAAHGKFDLIFFPAVYSYFPVPPGLKCVVTFHDAIAERHPALIFPSKRARLFWRMKTTLARYQSDFIITVSEHARRMLIEQWRLSPRKVRIINEGPSPIFRRHTDQAALDVILSRLGLETGVRYFIYVGGISPHKNLEFLLRCFLRLLEGTGLSDLKLLLVGDYQEDVFYSSFPAVSEIIGRNANRSVLLTGYVPDEELLHLYNGAIALVFPSLEEGFGLPAVEAMACGLPVIASNTGSLPGVVGDAGLLFDPHDENDLHSALTRIAGDPGLRKDLSARGLKRASNFSWKIAAETLLKTFEECLSGKL